MPAKRTMDDARRLLTIEPGDQCLYLPVGVGGINPSNGYARLTVSGTCWYAHRLSYTLHVGPVPDGLTVDHQCHNKDRACVDGLKPCQHRPCFRPTHLEAVTLAVNNARGGSPTAKNLRRERCPKGHKYMISRNGKRWCADCRHVHRQAIGEISARGRKVDRTHCPQGHEYSTANTYVYEHNGGLRRQCRQCGLDRAKARRLTRIEAST